VGSEYTKVSVSLPAPLVRRIKARVGTRGVSRYVAKALEEDERRAALRAWLAAQDAEYGPIPEEVMEKVRREWLGVAAGTS
jgi:Arc/MetJ-type ribon-helix-helix transcriptional regulator